MSSQSHVCGGRLVGPLVIFTPQVTLNPKSGANLAGVTIYRCNLKPLKKSNNGFELCIYLIWMYAGSLRRISASTMTSWHHFHSTNYPESQIWGQLGRCNSIRAQSYSLERAYQLPKHYVHAKYGCMKWSEVNISLNHAVMTSVSLHK